MSALTPAETEGIHPALQDIKSDMVQGEEIASFNSMDNRGYQTQSSRYSPGELAKLMRLGSPLETEPATTYTLLICRARLGTGTTVLQVVMAELSLPTERNSYPSRPGSDSPLAC